MVGKPSVAWGYNEILDMPDEDREYYVTQIADMIAQMKSKT